MGTTYNIKIVDHNKFIEKDIIKRDIDSILNKINNIFSTYIDSSEIKKFNNWNSVKPFQASPYFSYMVEKALYFNNITDETYDMTIKPLIDLWGFSDNYTYSMIPDSNHIDRILEYVGANHIRIKDNYIIKNKPNVKLDFNAIVKGDAVDKINDYLTNKNYFDFLVEIGGEIIVSGKNKSNKKWDIGILSPELNNNELFEAISITDKAIATSGTYNNYFTYEDIKYSHIINPKTGYPIEHDLVSATIIADNCITADAIATSIMVKGAKQGIDWLNKMEGIEGMLIARKDTNYSISKSNNFIY